MAAERWRATLGLITLFCVANGTPARALECGAYEDAERASYRTLTPADFAGEAPREAARRRSMYSPLIAISTTIGIDELGIRVEPTADGRFVARPSALCVRAYLLKELSARRIGGRDPWDLLHEQGHFDVTLVHARRLEGRLAALVHEAGSREAAQDGLWDRVEETYREQLRDCQADQIRYDRESHHGHQRRGQAHWTAQLASELALGTTTAVATTP